MKHTTSMRSRIASLLLLATLALVGPMSLPSFAQTLHYSEGGRVISVELATNRGKSDATKTTAALNSAIGLAIKHGVPLNIPAGDYLITGGAVTLTDQVIVSGVGEGKSRFFVSGAGALLTVDASLSAGTGKGVVLENFGLYSERTSTASGDVGLLIKNTGDANNAFTWVRNLVIAAAPGATGAGFHDGIIVSNSYFSSIRNVYIDGYRRYGIQITSTFTIDAGDHIIDGCWIQPASSGATGYDAAGANICLNQAPGTRVTNNKIFPGHTKGVWVHPNATFTTENFPALMTVIGPGNQFDSFGASATAVVLEGIWGTGVTGETQHGNKLANVQIIGNNLNNCGKLLDIKSESATNVQVIGNTAGSGGGIKVSSGAVVDGLFIASNCFDNRSYGTTVGATGSGYGPSKPIEQAGTVSNVKATGNYWLGFSSATDIVDSGGSSSSSFDVSEPSTQLAFSNNKLRVPANTGAVGNVWAVTSETDTVTWAITGDTAIADGSNGRLGLHYSGTLAAPKFAAPSGYTLVVRKGDTLPTSVDNRLVTIPWFVQGTRIFYSIEDRDTIAGLTTEGGGSAGTIMEDSFESSPGDINGRVPDVVAGPATWFHDLDLFDVNVAGYAHAVLESGYAARYDAGSADGVLTVVTNNPSTVSFPEIRFNFSSTTNYWSIGWRMSDGFVYIAKQVAGSTTTVHTTTLGTLPADTDITWTITIDDDDVTVARNGTIISALTTNEAGRALKTNDNFSIVNGGVGIVKWKNVKFESLP